MTDRHTVPPFPLRMPEDLRERVEAAAKRAGRSLNAEILDRLAGSLDGPTTDIAAIVEALDAFQKRTGTPYELKLGKVPKKGG